MTADDLQAHQRALADGLPSFGTVPQTMPTVITLCWAELQQAALVGCQRQIRALARGRQHRHGVTEQNAWQIHVAGATAEMAVAKALGVFWSDSPDLDYGGDVGTYHVRSTTHENGRLIVYRSDPPDAVFVLAVGAPPTYRIVGWIYAHDAQSMDYWSDDMRDPCFVVPQKALYSLAEIPRIARV